MSEAYLFDVDGVITDYVKKQVTKPQLIALLAGILQQGTPIGFISGRGLVWLRSRVVKVLEHYLDDHPALDRKMLDLVFVSGEFGGVFALHENGERKEMVNPDFSIPQNLREHLNTVAEQFAGFATIEHEKQTQFTMEANSGNDFFGPDGQQIAEALRQEITSYPQLAVQVDRIGMNVKNKDANKHYAVVQFLNWLAQKGLGPDHYFVFGDSPTDLEMGVELQNQGMQFDFIFVGDKEELKEHTPPFPITITQGHCDEGTVEYLSSKQSQTASMV